MAEIESIKEEQQFARANLQRTETRSAGFGNFYANDTQVQTSQWDMRLSFGLIEEIDQENGRAVIERVADVRLSLQHAKKLAQIMAEQIRQYEARFGPLPLLPE